DRAEHGHVVGPVPVHAALAELGAPEEVPATDDDADLDPQADDVSDLSRNRADDDRIDSDLAASEHLAGELEHDPLVDRGPPAGRRGRLVELCHRKAAPLLGSIPVANEAQS